MLCFSSQESENGENEKKTKQLTPREESYDSYIQGQLLFPSRVDLSDRNVSSRQRDADLAATIHKLAGIENILSVLSDGTDSAERKSQVLNNYDR
jgi:hypothetical protein